MDPMRATSILCALAATLTACAPPSARDAAPPSPVNAAQPDSPIKPARTESITPTSVRQTVAVDRLPQMLEGHRWTLDSLTDGRSQRMDLAPTGSPPFVFGFLGSRLVVQGGCNQLMGSYQIGAEGQLSVGRMASTMKACEAPLMQADAAMAALLAKPMRIEVVDGVQPILRLTSATNETLSLAGQATPETLYGAGTRIFLEVAPQRVACTNPLTGATSCLQTRERHYDERGLRVRTPGEWQPLYEPIEGFTHADGERKVLRLMRYRRSPAPPGGAATVYVLDLVVETEIVKP
jgi:heat shock protein HslJ